MASAKTREYARCICVVLVAAIVAACPRSAVAESAKCEVSVITEPPKSRVTFDGKERGASPASIITEAGAHLLVVKKDGYVEARRTVDIAPRQERKVVEVKLEPVVGLVLIRSTPTGATVEINKADRGRTPLLVTNLKPGSHRVVLAKRGHRTVEKMLQVKGRAPQLLDVRLSSDAATLKVTSEPAGARVVIDGVLRGETPCEVSDLSPESVELVLSLEGYQTVNSTVKLRTSEQVDFNAVLEPLPGSLVVHSIPEGALVYVNNRRRGKTPLTLKDLKPGRYRVRVESQGYAPLARTVVIKNGEEAIEEFRPERSSGLLQITTRPAGVKVFVDGKDRGATRAAGSSDAISEPFIVDLLKEGKHTVQLARRGYRNHSAEIEIEKERTATLEVKLERIFEPDTIVRVKTGEIYRGVMLKKHPNGDIELELRPGVFRLFKTLDISSVTPLVIDKKD